MATYIEYTLEDGSILLVEADESAGGAVKAADVSGNIIIKAEEKFKDAFKSVKSSVAALRQGLANLEADGIEVTFGMKTVGEVGLFTICKAGMEANYEVRLTWSNKEKTEKGEVEIS